MSFRELMSPREAEIIRRMKNHLKMPVLTIARAVGRHKKTIYRVLDPSTRRFPRLPSAQQASMDVLAPRAFSRPISFKCACFLGRRLEDVDVAAEWPGRRGAS